jgi:iron complex transport system ATP-binding protein
LVDELNLGITGVSTSLQPNALTITFERPMKALSSAVLNGGLVNARSIVNYHVPKTFSEPHPDKYLERIASRLRLPRPTIGLMTAVNIRNASVNKAREKDARVVSVITAGLSYPAAAGDNVSIEGVHQGTINTVILVEGSLTESAMVNAVKTATEAKSVALRDLDIKSRFSGQTASGTTSDSICVASCRNIPEWNYAGTSTAIGQAIARSVRAGVEDAVRREDGLTRNRSILDRLTERGIGFDDLVKTAMELFIASRSISKARASNLLQKGLRNALSDANVASLLLAALLLDAECGKGTVPDSMVETFRTDSVSLVADETIGIAIANYIAGTLGVHNFLYYDRIKPGIMKRLPPFTDDAVGGLVAGVMSKILQREG